MNLLFKNINKYKSNRLNRFIYCRCRVYYCCCYLYSCCITIACNRSNVGVIVLRAEKKMNLLFDADNDKKNNKINSSSNSRRLAILSKQRQQFAGMIIWPITSIDLIIVTIKIVHAISVELYEMEYAMSFKITFLVEIQYKITIFR